MIVSMVTIRDGNFPHMFFHFVKHEVLFLTVNICRYIKLTANFWNMGLKMPKNDKFHFLDTPPTFEAQL